MTINGQKAPSDIRFPDIDKIQDIEDVKQALRALRKEMEREHREMHRDQQNVYNVELPGVEGIIDFDIPLVANLNFRLSGSGIQWDEGTLRFGGITYTVSSGNVDPATTVYVDVSSLSSPITLGTINGDATIVVDRWYLSNRDGSNVHSVVQSSIMHAGLLQANTVTATQINTSGINLSEWAGDLDNIDNGSDFHKVSSIAVDGAGGVLLNQAIGTLNDIGDGFGVGTNYSRVLSTSITAGGLVILAQVSGDLDDVDNGSTYERVLKTNIFAGGIIISNTVNGSGGAASVTDLDFTGDLDADLTSANTSADTVLVEGVTILLGGLIATNLVVANSINVTNIAAINADLGTITAGFIGSATDFFDITNSVIELKDASNDKFLYMTDGALSIYTAAAGGGSRMWDVSWDTSEPGVTMRFNSINGSAFESNMIFSEDGVEKASIGDGVGIPKRIKGFEINLCNVTSSNPLPSAGVKGHLAYGSALDVLYVSNGSGLMTIPALVTIQTGQILYASSTNVYAAKATGSTGQVLTMTSSNVFDWQTPSTPQIKIGTYQGDGTATQAITGIGFQPDALFVTGAGLNAFVRINGMGGTASKNLSGSGDPSDSIRVLDSDGFTVGNGGGVGAHDLNLVATYFFIAWKE